MNDTAMCPHCGNVGPRWFGSPEGASPIPHTAEVRAVLYDHAIEQLRPEEIEAERRRRAENTERDDIQQR